MTPRRLSEKRFPPTLAEDRSSWEAQLRVQLNLDGGII